MKKVIILGVLILSVTIPALSLAAQPTVSTEASVSGSSASVTVQSDTALPNSLLDLELYDSSGNKITQGYASIDIPNGSLACSWNMNAPAGAYTLRIGVFNDNWTALYSWNNSAATATGPFTGTNTISCNGASVPTTFISSASVQGSAAGNSGIFTTTVQADHSAPNVLIDTEIFDAANNKINQWFETDALTAGTPFTITHQAALPSAGNYFIKVGVFSPDWSTLYLWNNAAGTFTTVATTSGGNPPPPTNNTGVITPATQTVQPGASVDFTGHNFGHEETVLIVRNGTNVSSVHADGGGNFSTGAISMPNANSTYVFTFTGQTSGILGTSTIQIGPITQPPPQSNFSFSIANSNAVPPSQVLVNTNNQPLGAFTTTIQGEGVNLSSLSLYIATSSTGSGLLQNVSLTNSTGQVIGGPNDSVYDAVTGKQKVTFVSPIFFDSGTQVYKVIGMLPSTFVNGGVVTVTTDPAINWGTATSYPSHTVETLPNTSVSLNSMTVQRGSLAIDLSSTPIAQSITAGGNVLFANIQLDASASPEDTRMSSLPVSFAGSASDVSGCQLENGSTMLNTGSRVVNILSTTGANTFSFDNSLTIPKGTVTTLSVICNVSAAAVSGNTYRFGINSAYSYNSTGSASGITITPTVTTNAGPVMTVQ